MEVAANGKRDRIFWGHHYWIDHFVSRLRQSNSRQGLVWSAGLSELNTWPTGRYKTVEVACFTFSSPRCVGRLKHTFLARFNLLQKTQTMHAAEQYFVNRGHHTNWRHQSWLGILLLQSFLVPIVLVFGVPLVTVARQRQALSALIFTITRTEKAELKVRGPWWCNKPKSTTFPIKCFA